MIREGIKQLTQLILRLQVHAEQNCLTGQLYYAQGALQEWFCGEFTYVV